MTGRWQLAALLGSSTTPHSYIGTKLRKARLARGLTTVDLATKLGFPVPLIEAIERGQTEDQLPAVMAISIELDLDLKDLFGSVHGPTFTTPPTSRIRLH